jgi:hypothetical protein
MNICSPKDAAFYTMKMKKLIEDDLKKSKFDGKSPEAEIEDIITFTRASCRCLAVESGTEALLLFTRR